ncbi:MAG TPA: D-serine ammonia-lyase [Oscillospiraceae bacterium]|nr:D-serine ammonia-lyase [Oscillospiraceae bacterium]HPS35813.1 D-serine ammonia-lyase [Oscillospiraceae bacterium]
MKPIIDINTELLEDLKNARPVVWVNPELKPFDEVKSGLALHREDIVDAEERLMRFAPLIQRIFPETTVSKGIIESPLRELPKMKTALEKRYGIQITGRLFLKCDHELPVAGSVKARGGIYEVLKFTEKLAEENGFDRKDYASLADEKWRKCFSAYSILVGSTGNLGLSIGTMSAVLGYRAVVHMSADAKEWKKNLLRSRGVEVIEHPAAYSVAVCNARDEAKKDDRSYFVDDEHSTDLFLGYAVAADRLKSQMDALGLAQTPESALAAYLPCGVGGAPGGITFGLKTVYGDAAKSWFIQSAQSPCMLLGMASKLYNGIRVDDIGLSGKTDADGLAVGRPSGLVSGMMKNLVSGICTIADEEMYPLLALLKETEDIYIEPSAATCLFGPVAAAKAGKKADIHICWATGGSMVPKETAQMHIQKGKQMLVPVSPI